MTICQVDGCDRAAAARWPRAAPEGDAWLLCEVHLQELAAGRSTVDADGRLQINDNAPYEIVRLAVVDRDETTARISLGLGRYGVELQRVEFLVSRREVMGLCSMVTGSPHSDVAPARG